MTKIVFYKNKKNVIYGFEIEGHTDFGFEGSDPLCAAISVLASHTIGSIHEFTDDPCENRVDKDIPRVSFFLTTDDFSDLSAIFLVALLSSFEDLAGAHPDNLTIELKED